MGMKRIGPTGYTTVAQVRDDTRFDNQRTDSIYVEANKRFYMWIPGSTAADDGVKVIANTADATGRWVSLIASADVLNASLVVPALVDSGGDTFAVPVAGLPAGAAVSVSVTNADVAYGGAVIPNGLMITPNNVAGNGIVYITVHNNLGSDSISFTMNLSVVYN